MANAERQVMHRAWAYFVLLLCCYLLAPFHRTVPGTLALDIMDDFAMGGGLLSLLGAMFFYPYAFMQIPAGILADRWGARLTATLFLAIAAAGTFLFATASSVAVAVAGRMMVGMGTAMLFVPGLRVLLNWFPPHLHGLCTGLFLSLGTCGMFLAAGPLSWLAARNGWREAMLMVAIGTALMALACALWLRNKPEDKKLPAWRERTTEPEAMPPGKALFHIMKNRTYWGVSLWFFCLWGVLYAFSGLWGAPYFTDAYGLSEQQTSVVLMAVSGGAIVGPSFHGAVASWVSLSKRSLMLIIGLCGLALCVPLLLPFMVLPHGALPVWGFCFSLFVGGSGSIGLLKIQEDFPSSMVGTATGMVNVHTALGGGVVQLATGWLMQHTAGSGPYDMTVYARMFSLFFLLIVMACAAALLCPQRMTREKSDTPEKHVASPS